MTITPKITKNIAGMWLKPNIPANGVKGKINVMQTTPNVAINKYLPGALLKNGRRVRITSTINAAEITDSKNQPVLN